VADEGGRQSDSLRPVYGLPQLGSSLLPRKELLPAIPALLGSMDPRQAALPSDASNLLAAQWPRAEVAPLSPGEASDRLFRPAEGQDVPEIGSWPQGFAPGEDALAAVGHYVGLAEAHFGNEDGFHADQLGWRAAVAGLPRSGMSAEVSTSRERAAAPAG